MDYLKYGWEVVKKDLVPWVIFGLVLGITLSFGIGFFLMPNALRATRRAIEAGGAPGIGDLFNFDNITDDAIVMFIASIAHTVGAMLCGVGIFASLPLMHFAPYLVAEGRYDAVSAAKASVEYGKGNLVGILLHLLLFGVLVNLAVYLTCGIGGFIVAPIGLVAMDKYYLDHRDAILAAANQAQIPMKA